jgi:glucuronokinase
MRTHGRYEYGAYEALDPALLPPLYIAYKADVSEPTEVFHNEIRSRFLVGEPAVVGAMRTFASLAEEALTCLLDGNTARLEALINTNFDTRRSIYKLPDAQVEIIERARRAGASAKFAGSGGAIIGVYRDEAAFEHLRAELAKIGCVVIKPMVTEL